MKKVVLGFVILVLLAGGFVVINVRSYLSATHGTPGGSAVKFTVHPGDSLSTLGPSLRSAGVIDSTRDFKIWLRLSGDSLSLQRGDYDMRRHMGYDQIVSTLAKGPVVISEGLLLREGLTVTGTATAVGNLKIAHISPDAFQAAATTATVVPGVPAPRAATLEGYLYPDTYSVDPKETAEGLVRQIVAEFNKKAAQINWSSPPGGVTPYQALIVASMVEREAKAANDGPMIASVIYNRLKAGMKLGIDATVYYAVHKPFGANLTQSDLATTSPYNTRAVTGLPPTPIDSPQFSSMQAALQPSVSDNVYYVLSSDCVHHSFFKTKAEFDAAAARQPKC
ncbi:MAG TPA: endolytic transglycosylase MltG [Actinomycetota bacterium]|nr:endolytic transglycosylase MltG [Actinomycetota bacterium]